MEAERYFDRCHPLTPHENLNVPGPRLRKVEHGAEHPIAFGSGRHPARICYATYVVGHFDLGLRNWRALGLTELDLELVIPHPRAPGEGGIQRDLQIAGPLRGWGDASSPRNV
jgi:hypothetical protein